jgi:serine protease DegQ
VRVTTLLIAFASILCSVSASAETPRPLKPNSRPSALAMSDPVGSFAPMLATVIPAVVTILVVGETTQPVEIKPRNADGTLDPLPRPKKEPFRAGGSGVIIDRARGHILTNNHVIEDAVKIEVSLSDGRRMPARLLGRDIGTDIAVIEVTERDLPSIVIGNSDSSRVGDVVAAVGNPFGLEGTATLGIISALMRTEVGHGAFEDFMQIDASINPGNSGGALVNVRGELIGLNTAGPSEQGKGAGIGFAIPINMARAIATELIAKGKMKRGSPGLIVEDLSYELMMSLGTKLTRGAHIVEVVPNSPAAAAGIKPGGIVVSMSNKPVRNASEFSTRIDTVPAGTRLTAVIHTGKLASSYDLEAAEIVLKSLERVIPAEFGGIGGATVGDIRLGNPLFGDLRGAQVLRVPTGSRAHASGLDTGDVIVAVDNGSVRTADDFFRLGDGTGMQYRVKILRKGTPGWLRVTR